MRARLDFKIESSKKSWSSFTKSVTDSYTEYSLKWRFVNNGIFGIDETPESWTRFRWGKAYVLGIQRVWSTLSSNDMFDLQGFICSKTRAGSSQNSLMYRSIKSLINCGFWSYGRFEWRLHKTRGFGISYLDPKFLLIERSLKFPELLGFNFTFFQK